MKKILVPVDFSKASANALRYAIQLYGNDTEFILSHVTQGLVDTNGQFHISTLASQIENFKHKLRTFQEEALSGMESTAIFKYEVLAGNIVFAIRNYINDNPMTYAVVMASKDRVDILDKWIGTHSLGIVKNLNIPVHLIPPHAEFKGLEKVMVACDNPYDNHHGMKNIMNWNDSYQSELQFLLVNNQKTQIDGKVYNDQVMDTFEHKLHEYDISTHVIVGDDPANTILGQAYNRHADMVIVLPEQHSFLHTLLFSSVSKKIINQSSIPILFIPKDSSIRIEAHRKEWSSTPDRQQKSIVRGFNFRNHWDAAQKKYRTIQT